VGSLIGLAMLIGGVWCWRRIGYLPPVLPESEDSYRSGINLIVGVFAFAFLVAGVLFALGNLE